MTKSVELAQFGGLVSVSGNDVTLLGSKLGLGRTPVTFLLELQGGMASYDVGAGGNPQFIARAHPSVNQGEVGTLSNHPLSLITNSAEAVNIDANGVMLIRKSAGGIGYGSGSGGTVTQATSKSTAVTLNRPSGQITMNAAALAANTEVGFTLNNSLLTATDIVMVQINNAGNYQVRATDQAAGSVVIRVRNLTAGSLSDSPLINFAIIKGANA